VTESTALPLSATQIEDLKLASSKMLGSNRRSFQAAMTLKYCEGNARQAERVFGWGRATVQLGLRESRTGVICLGAQAACCGNQLWEEKHPKVAEALWALAESHSQQAPTFRTALSYTRLTAAEALKQLRAQGFREDQLPSPSTMADILNRNGYRLRKGVKAKPQKKSRKPMPSLPTSRKRTASPWWVDTSSG
jgi:DDE family transposase